LWPVGVFQQRAEGIGQRLPGWGRDLYRAALGDEQAREALAAWRQAADGAERRFSIMMDRDLPSVRPSGVRWSRGGGHRAAGTALGAATRWPRLAVQGKHAVQVRRRLPNRQAQAERLTGLPVRILLVSPRPERDGKGMGSAISTTGSAPGRWSRYTQTGADTPTTDQDASSAASARFRISWMTAVLASA
jgi:hypothetical protein